MCSTKIKIQLVHNIFIHSVTSVLYKDSSH